MSVLINLVAAIFAALYLLWGQVAFAVDGIKLIPDRCPEPCEVGGTHVSEDFQRLTVPFRIRNGESGNYLKLNGRSPTTAPLVKGDDSFLWVLVPGPKIAYDSPDVSAIIDGNNFEKRVYKLINLKDSMALMSTPFFGGFRYVTGNGTHLGADQFWLFRRNLKTAASSEYMIYNPSVTGFRAEHIYENSASVKINIAGAPAATMPALAQSRGYLTTTTGGNFNNSGFTWHFEEAPQPRDLARLTIKSVTALKLARPA